MPQQPDLPSDAAAAAQYAQRIETAADFLRPRLVRPFDTVLILGSGLGTLADAMASDSSCSFTEIPGFVSSTALGHAGRLHFGSLVGRSLAVMQGRLHAYEGYSLDQITFPLRVLHRLGARRLIATNASGGLNPRLSQGDLLLVADHLNLLWIRPRPQAEREHDRAPPPFETAAGELSPYDPHWIDQTLEAACCENIPAHRGVYAAVPGPNYETRAELRMLRRLGADAVGMSTVPEALVARQCGMRVLAISTVTNVCRPDAPHRVSGAAVVAAAAQVAPRVARLLSRLLSKS